MKKAIWLLAFILAYGLAFRGFEYFWYLFYLDSYFPPDARILILIIANLILLTVFLLYRYRTRKRRLDEEANKYLARRMRERAVPLPANRKRMRRRLLWVPSLLVSIVFMFVPETVGIASHLFLSRTAVLDKYRVQTPITWIVGYTPDNYLWAITAPGIGRIGFQRYWRNDVPVSEMGFIPIHHPELQLDKNVPLNNSTILAKHSFGLGTESLTCWDLIHHNRFVGPSPTDPSIADIRCSSESEHFYAYFVGWRGDLPRFYKTMQSIKTVE
jgi:hypothetical protein